MKNDILTLWDVDKTTIMGLGAHLESFTFALKNVYGIDGAVRSEQHGLTDKGIIFDILKENGVDEYKIEANFSKCEDEMVGYFLKNIYKYEIVAMPGANDVLKELQKRNILTGLVTGNMEQIARGKLKIVGMNDYFKFGGFGNESRERSDLVKLAVKRSEVYGFSGNNENVYIFDDTVLGIIAGNKAGVKTIGVASGSYSMRQLKEVGAYKVLKGLQNTDKVLEILNI